MEPAEGVWWKFSQYEVVNGYIQPAGGAYLEQVDPWGGYWNRPRNESERPYLELMALVAEFPTDRPLLLLENRPLMQGLESGVIEWCQDYGLLGLLPHSLVTARIGKTMVARSGGRFIEIEDWPTSPEDPEEPDYTIIEDEAGRFQYDRSNHKWWMYFRNLWGVDAELQNLPMPMSEAFWLEYAEPFQPFIDSAKTFANAFLVLSEARESSIREWVPQLGKVVKLNVADAMERLNRLASPVSPTVIRKKWKLGWRYATRWESPSLLGHLAMQALQDLTGDCRIVKCPCSKIVVSTHHKKKFCSKKCQQRFNKRGQRHRS